MMQTTISTNSYLESGYLNVTDNTKLSHLVMGLPVSDTRGTMDRAVREVAYDSRKVGPDSLFVAIPGGNLDGGAFIKDAIAQGASAFITQMPLDSLNGLGLGSRDITALHVEDSRKALSIVSANFYSNPSER
ncbi:MAG: hypothetical protein HOI59_05385, partial [Nitrospina sp.]|nr:hypothetical protein [Nitrospina sp.]